MLKNLILTVIIFFTAGDIFCSDVTFAFGYFKNNSKNKSYDYLEKVFSNSIVSSLAEKEITLLRPADIENKLKNKNDKLLYEFSEKELAELSEIIECDYFMYGNFTPFDNDDVKIVINIYNYNTNELFTFETLGKLETEIFSLVDFLSTVIFNAAGEKVFFKNEVIPESSKFSIISNLEPTELNEMYSVFMDKNFSISVVQSNDLYNATGSDEMEFFYNIISSKNSLKKLKDADLKKEVNFIYGSWNNESETNLIKEQNSIINFYYYDYPVSKQNALKSLSQNTKNKDYLLLIFFNPSRTKAFVRCIDFKTGNLIWMERNIEPVKELKKESKSSKVTQLTTEIIKHFQITSNKSETKPDATKKKTGKNK